MRDHHRRSLRLRGYDYAQGGAYFITACTRHRACAFGDVVDGQMHSNDAGAVVQVTWNALPRHFPFVELDAFVVMPNHAHGILWIAGNDAGATHASPRQPLPGPRRGSVGAIVGSFKSAASKGINALRGTPGASTWQRNYHEYVVRDEESLNRIRRYIADNPAQWATDRENPGHA